MRVLVTGAAGFIGAEVSARLLGRGDHVHGIDNLNNYYDVGLKKARLDRLVCQNNFEFVEADISNKDSLIRLFSIEPFDVVVNLAAQPGVRYSLTNPDAYIQCNIVGFFNVLEACRHHDVKHLVYASSSSVYGANKKLPYSVDDNVDHPVSLYAATKKSNELMAHTYSHLYGIPTTGLRFFTVYGPWGRPDMAYFSFTRAIMEGRPIDVFNNGEMRRDFTYIDDIVEGVLRVVDRPPHKGVGSIDSSGCENSVPYKIYNIGNNKPVMLLDFIETLERLLGRSVVKNFLPMQPGDVKETYANIDGLSDGVGFRPSTSIEKGLEEFVRWYRRYYSV